MVYELCLPFLKPLQVGLELFFGLRDFLSWKLRASLALAKSLAKEESTELQFAKLDFDFARFVSVSFISSRTSAKELFVVCNLLVSCCALL